MGEGSWKCIPALKYWAFYSREKFSHIAKSQDYFLIIQKHLWDKWSTYVARIYRNTSFLFHTFCGSYFKYFFPVVQSCCIWKDAAFWVTSELFGRDGQGEEMVRSFPITRPTWPVFPVSGWHIAAQYCVFFKSIFRMLCCSFFPLKMPFPNKNVSMYCLEYI